jgi:superfamily II DNA or RNA helicase
VLVTAMARAADSLRLIGFDHKSLVEDEASEDELQLVGLVRASAAADDESSAPAAAAAANKKMTKTKAAAVAAAAAAASSSQAPKSTALVYLLPGLASDLQRLASKSGKQGDLGSNETKAGDLLRFQLAHMGHLMDIGGPPNAPDPRVAFAPDRWQRQLLDIVDRRASAVVVAPTSSGKTFISYYAMKAVAVDISRPDGTVVFVVPTKALMNQVAAQVYYTFGDKFGILTREYRHNVENCRFLVTVAESLSVQLRSAEHVQWTSRIRYAVIDEAHFIGAGIEGVAVEACFAMLQCPILALSATIGNPQELRSWIVSVQESKRKRCEAAGEEVDYSFDVLTVPGADDPPIHRHADLQKYVYLPESVQSNETFRAADDAERAVERYNARLKADDARGASAGAFVGFDLPKDAEAINDERNRRSGMLVPMSPLSAASLGIGAVAAKSVLPNQLTLSPPEVVTLYDTMVTVVGAQEAAADAGVGSRVSAALKKLNPATVLGRGFVTRSAVRAYEDTLQTLLRSWLDGAGVSDVSGAFLQRCGVAVLEQMRAELDRRATSVNDSYLAELQAAAKHGVDAATKGLAPHPSSFDFLETHVLSLLIALERGDQLPVLVFHESGSGCERMCEAVVSALERLEVARNGETDAAKEAKAAKKAEKARKKAEDAATKKKTIGNKAEDKDDKDDEKDQVTAAEEYLDPAAQHVAPAFSFVRATLATLTPNGVDEMITYAVGRSKLLDPSSPLVRGLRRGIGVHHMLAERKYRETVEVLFRSRYIQVVFCTASLAYGIHMPCRTVVFAGDSLSLSALEFNQMAGRAGRRGYDLIGNVVFFGVPLTRVRALVAADVPSLEGVAPSVAALALRATLLAQKQTNVGDPDNAVRRLAYLMRSSLSVPFFAIHAPARVRQLGYRFCFALDALCRFGAVTEADGTPLPLSGLQVFLSDCEYSAPVFVRMLRSGALHRLCTTSRTRNSDAVQASLLLVMSHLFNRQALSTVHRLIAMRLADPSSALAAEFAAENLPIGSVALAPLAADLRGVVVAHDRDALREAASWARYTARQLGTLEAEHRKLPLTHTAFAAASADAQSSLTSAASAAAQRAGVSPVRSPFTALSRHSDQFVSPRELKSAARRDLAVDCNSFVSQWIDTDAAGRAIPGNAYGVDMYRHGVPDACVRENGIENGEVWYTLRDLSRNIEIVKVGIEHHCLERSARDPVFVALGQLVDQFTSRASRIWA